MTQFVKKELAEELQKEYPRNFTIVKNRRGGLAFQLQPFDYSAPERLIFMKWDKEFEVLPTKWILGIFTNEGPLRQLERGYFTVQNLDLLIELAESEGLYVPDSIKEPKITIKQMEKALIKGDIALIKTLMALATKKDIQDFVDAARRVITRMNYETVAWVQNTYKVSLATINLDE